MTPTLYNIYKNQGQALPSTAEARFADPKFASAASQAGITKDQYSVGTNNAGLNTKIASLYGKTPITPTNTGVITATSTGAVTNAIQPVVNKGVVTPAPMSDIYSDYNSYTENPNTYLQNKGITEANSRQQALSAIQAQVDSTNNYYADQLRQAQARGQGNLGTTGAIQARRGLLGSDFGTALTDNVNTANTNVYNSIENEKQLRIQELLSEAEKSGVDRYQKERTSIEEGLKSRIDFLKGAEERRKAGATDATSALLASGHTPKDLTPEQMAAYAKGYGTTESAINNSFNLSSYQKKQEQIKRQQGVEDALAKKGIENVSEGAKGYAYNPTTKKYELVANNPKTYAPVTARSAGGVARGALGDAVIGSTTGSTVDIKSLSPTAQAYINAITRGDSTLTEVLTKIGASKIGLALKNEIILGYDSITGGNKGTKLITGPENANFTALKANADKIDTTMYGQLDTKSGFFSEIANPTSSSYLSNLLDNLSLEKRDLLKGSGAISDFESRMLANSVSILKSRNISETDAADALKAVKDILDGKIKTYATQTQQGNQQSGGTPITAPDGTQVIIVN